MTRRIDWRDGATRATQTMVRAMDADLADLRKQAARVSAERKRLIAKCYAKAARAAKRGK